MTLRDLYKILKKTEFDVAYNEFKDEPQTMPYITYRETGRHIITADDTIYQEFKFISIILHTKSKSPESEKILEDALRSHGIIYDFSELGENDEEVYEVEYEIEI